MVTNAAGLEKTLKALRSEGRLDDNHAALVAMAKGLAQAVDSEPDNAALWREYRAVLVALSNAGSDNIDDDTRDFLLRIRTPRASMGDS